MKSQITTKIAVGLPEMSFPEFDDSRESAGGIAASSGVSARQSIAVLGSMGYVGRHLVQQLQLRGRPVLPICRATHGNFMDARPNWFNRVNTILWAATATSQVTDDNDAFHRSEKAFARCARMAVESGVSKVGLVSSACVYGTKRNRPLKETDKLSPENQYGESCLNIENLCGEIFGKKNSSIFRGFNFFGGGGRGLIDKLLASRELNSPVRIHNPHAVRDHIEIREASRLITSGMGASGTFNIGVGIGRTNAELGHVLGGKVTLQDHQHGELIDSSVADIHRICSFVKPPKDRLKALIETSTTLRGKLPSGGS